MPTMGLCGKCRNITFCQVSGDNELDYEAEIWPDLASLRAAAAQRLCRFCVLLDGLIEHQRWSHSSKPQTVHNVTLKLGYPDEDLESLDIDGEEEDYPSYIMVWHPNGLNTAIQIGDPKALSRSSWDDIQEDVADEVAALSLEDGSSTRLSSENDSTGSDAALKLAARWLDECRQHHVSCRKGLLQQVKVPTRLVDVSRAGDSDGRVVVVSSSDAGLGTSSSIDSRYATLSHRWTPNNPHTLTTSNLAELTTNGLRVSDLSNTFAEACITTHKMGLKYLWIDSLCILQDSGADKTVEIPLMGDYYGNAELNIAAATEDIGGLWRKREALATEPMRLPINIVLPDGRGTRQYILDITPVLEHSGSHLDSRGWILQERLFPLRTLFFDPYWIAFDCAEMVAAENCQEGVLKNGLTAEDTRMLSKHFWSTERDFSLSTTGGAIRRIGNAAVTRQKHIRQGQSVNVDLKDRQQLYRLWFRVVKDFTRRSLTFESDRLPAISALAERLGVIINDDTYVAGLWKNEIIRGLEWYNHFVTPYKGVTRAPAAKAHAPSWSWASLEVRTHADDPKDRHGKPTLYAGIVTTDYEREIEPQVSILDVSWELANGAAPFGAVVNATIVLRGRPIRGRCLSRYRPMKHLPDVTAEDVLDQVSEESIVTQGVQMHEAQTWPEAKSMKPGSGWNIHASGEDASGRRGRMVSMGYNNDTGDISERYVHLLPLLKNTYGGTSLQVLFCLVLEDTGDGVTYRRIGAAPFGLKSLVWAKERVIKLV